MGKQTTNFPSFNQFFFLSILFHPGVCPVLCSGHGHYGGGMCHCEEGWKGPDCDVPIAECQVPGCSGHGRCIEGECHCERGWKGLFCEQCKYIFFKKLFLFLINP